MKKMPITLLCGAALMVVTILVYFILFNNIVWQAIHFITLVAVLVAEAITTTYVYFGNICSFKSRTKFIFYYET